MKASKLMGNLQAWSVRVTCLRNENPRMKTFYMSEPSNILLEIERFKSMFTEDEICKLRKECFSSDTNGEFIIRE